MTKVNLEDAMKSKKRPRLTSYQWEKLRLAVIQRDKKCKVCKNKVGEFHVDHIIPHRLGGSNEMENLQLLCNECHKKKTVEDIEKIRRTRRFKRYEGRIGGFDK